MPRDTTLDLFTPYFETLADPRVPCGRHHALLNIEPSTGVTDTVMRRCRAAGISRC